MSRNQISLFEGQRQTLDEALELTIQSLIRAASEYRNWAIAYSGGKDSSALVTVVLTLIAEGRVPVPESLTVLYADTRLELLPLHINALKTLEICRQRGHDARVVMPPVDKRFFVYMLGRGVPPPNNNTLRWCTAQIKINPMLDALREVRSRVGQKILMLTGVRVGESAVRDARIAISCGRNGAECGQGWFQETTPESIADTLAPLLHWRVCHIWDWLQLYAPIQGFPTAMLCDVYGGDEAVEVNARTGCTGCPLASEDTALNGLLEMPQWSYLAPLTLLRPLYRELREFRNRKQKDAERNQDGHLSSSPNRKGPLTLDARSMALERVLTIQSSVNVMADMQDRPRIDLINAEEEAAIRDLIARRVYPNRWSDDDPDASVLIDKTLAEGVTQPLLGMTL